METVLSDPNLLGLIIEELDDITIAACHLVNKSFYGVAKRPLAKVYFSAMRYPHYRDMVKARDLDIYYQGAAYFGVYLKAPWSETRKYIKYCLEYDFVEGLSDENMDCVGSIVQNQNTFITIVNEESWRCFTKLWELVVKADIKFTWDDHIGDMLLSGRIDFIDMILERIEPQTDRISEMGFRMLDLIEYDFDNHFIKLLEHYGIDAVDPGKEMLGCALDCQDEERPDIEKMVEYLLSKGYEMPVDY